MTVKPFLITQVQIVDPRSPKNGMVSDIIIQNGRLSFEIPDHFDGEVLDGKGMLFMPGLIDLGVSTGSPGLEHRDDFRSIKWQGLFSGVLDLIAFPDGNPPFDKSPSPKYNGQNEDVQIHFLGCISQNREGNEMSELFDLAQMGVLGFSDGRRPIQDVSLLRKVLEYTLTFKIPVLNRPEDQLLAIGGKMHEGKVHAGLGLKGIPDLAEILMLQRDLEICKYTGGVFHALGISTQKSIQLIREAKKINPQITCSVNIMNLLLTDEAMVTFDGNLKIQPPLRDKLTRKALLQGIREGVIDIIRSDHAPFSPEEKEVEFDYTPSGAAQLQTFNSLYFTYLKEELTLEEWILYTAIKPSEIFGISRGVLEEGQIIQAILFDPSAEWTLTDHSNLSKSRNSPWWKSKLKGKVVKVFRHNEQ